MKELPTAPRSDFAMYIARSDTRFIEREAVDSLEHLYDQGYLPYSGATGLHTIFYSARSARVALHTFALTSENRRIAKKFDGQFTKERIDARSFIADESFYTFVLSYFAQKHGAEVMPRARLKLLFATGLISTVVVYRQDTNVIGYVLEVESGSMRHYWYSAYDLSLAQQSLGLWLMLDCIRDAQVQGFAFYYLGTLYGQKALYKANFEPLEWWSGSEWSRNIKLLKEKARAD